MAEAKKCQKTPESGAIPGVSEGAETAREPALRIRSGAAGEGNGSRTNAARFRDPELLWRSVLEDRLALLGEGGSGLGEVR